MASSSDGFSIDLQYRFGRRPGDDKPLSHPLIAMLRARPGTHKLIGFARRMQGLIVAPGNPLGLRSIADLARPGLRFVARQPGSGTRLLTESLLERAGLDAARLGGLERCEESHLAVAASVACAVADVGLGIEAAARSFGLDFVPLVEERYCFVCLKPALEHPAVQQLREVLASEAWGRQLAALDGYEPDGGGRVLRLTQAPWWSEMVATPRRARCGRAERGGARRRELANGSAARCWGCTSATARRSMRARDRSRCMRRATCAAGRATCATACGRGCASCATEPRASPPGRRVPGAPLRVLPPLARHEHS